MNKHLISLALATLVPLSANAVAKIVIVNANAPGVGFNDPTPAQPVGGNAGNTVGSQRLVAFKNAAAAWSDTLSGGQTISVKASFDALTPCSATAGVVGRAGPTSFYSQDSHFPFPNLFYPAALAINLMNMDPNPSTPSISASFNSNIGTASCLTNSGWYYGLDGNHGSNINLLSVLLHEFAHGLGFSTLVDWNTGTNPSNTPDIFQHSLFDETANAHWDVMTDAQRFASFTNTRKLVWDGSQVTSAVPNVLMVGTPSLGVTSPPSLAGELLVGSAQFGPTLTSGGLQGSLQLAQDSNSDSTMRTLGCVSPLQAFNGKIALIDRGTCTFVVKVKNAQDAGAVAVVIADNVAGTPPNGMSGTDSTITIPSVRITLDDGNRIKTALNGGTVAVNLHLLPTRSGSDANNHALMYTPNPEIIASSVVHFDVNTNPALLMAPIYPPNLAQYDLDLTRPLLGDIGWTVAAGNPTPRTADISATLTGPARTAVASSISVTLVVTNNGPAAVTDAFVISAAPDGLTFSSNQGDCTSAFPCELGSMQVGSTKTITTQWSVPLAYSGANPIVVQATALSGAADNAPSNNVASVQVSLSNGKSGGCSCSESSGLAPTLILGLVGLQAVGRRRRRG